MTSILDRFNAEDKIKGEIELAFRDKKYDKQWELWNLYGAKLPQYFLLQALVNKNFEFVDELLNYLNDIDDKDVIRNLLDYRYRMNKAIRENRINLYGFLNHLNIYDVDTINEVLTYAPMVYLLAMDYADNNIKGYFIKTIQPVVENLDYNYPGWQNVDPWVVIEYLSHKEPPQYKVESLTFGLAPKSVELQFDRNRVSAEPTTVGNNYYTLDELRNWCRYFKLPVTGVKADLAQRLRNQ